MKRPLEIGKIKNGLHLFCSHCLKNGSPIPIAIYNVSASCSLLIACEVGSSKCQSTPVVHHSTSNKALPSILHSSTSYFASSSSRG